MHTLFQCCTSGIWRCPYFKDLISSIFPISIAIYIHACAGEYYKVTFKSSLLLYVGGKGWPEAKFYVYLCYLMSIVHLSNGSRHSCVRGMQVSKYLHLRSYNIQLLIGMQPVPEQNVHFKGSEKWGSTVILWIIGFSLWILVLKLAARAHKNGRLE